MSPPRVELRVPQPADQAEFLARVAASRDLHRPWAYPPADPQSYAAYLDRLRAGDTAGFLACRVPDGAICAMINLGNIVRRGLQSCSVGYCAFAPFAGQGYTSAGLALALDHAFGTLRLHRVEANIQPGNTASLALVVRLGFRREGFSPRYLFLGGEWRDHERWALLAEEWDPQPATSSR